MQKYLDFKEAKCKNCYKCLKICPVKAIKIEDNQAKIIEDKCILCGLCVRVCNEVAKKGILGLVGRGFTTTIKPEFRNDDVTAYCKDCHKCADACPTGALKIL